MLALIARAAGAVPLLPEDAGFKTLEPVVNSCACCEGSLAAMLDYCRAQKPMGDLHMEHFSCDNIHSPGCGASEAKRDCEARMAQLRQDNCTLKCKALNTETAHIERLQSLQKQATGLIGIGLLATCTGAGNFVWGMFSDKLSYGEWIPDQSESAESAPHAAT